jgi:putative RNA 2'-phosphotransferase
MPVIHRDADPMNTPCLPTRNPRQNPHQFHVGLHRSAEVPGGYVEPHSTAEFSQVSIATSTVSQPASPALPASPSTPSLLRYVLWILRHAPDQVGIEIDREGWVNLEDLYEHLSQTWPSPECRSPSDLRGYLEAHNRFERFSFTATRCRANYGHSTSLFQPSLLQPLPLPLYHATASTNLPSIRAFGLLPGRRRFVQLTTRLDYALTIVPKHRELVILEIVQNLDLPYLHGYHSGAHVWLADFVPSQCLRLYDSATWSQSDHMIPVAAPCLLEGQDRAML